MKISGVPNGNIRQSVVCPFSRNGQLQVAHASCHAHLVPQRMFHYGNESIYEFGDSPKGMYQVILGAFGSAFTRVVVLCCC